MAPLPLISTRWKELRQAYGSAKDTPELLKKLENDPKLWDEVWSTLCHQNDIYSATYAAIPHLVLLAKQGDLEHQLWTLIFCGTVKSSGNLVGGPVPPDLMDSYDSAIETLNAMAADLARQAISKNLLDKFPAHYLAQAILSLRHGANPECPECDTEYKINPEEDFDLELLEKIIKSSDFEATCNECGYEFNYLI